MAGFHFGDRMRTEPRTRPDRNSLPPACTTSACGKEARGDFPPAGWTRLQIGDQPSRDFCTARCGARALARHDLQATA